MFDFEMKTEYGACQMIIARMLCNSKAFPCPSTKPTDQGCTTYKPLSSWEVANFTSKASRWDSKPFSRKDWKWRQYWWLVGKRPTAPYFDFSEKSNIHGSKKKFCMDLDGMDCTVVSIAMCLFTFFRPNRYFIPSMLKRQFQSHMSMFNFKLKPTCDFETIQHVEVSYP